MIAILHCRCANSELRARRMLMNIGMENYMSPKSYEGKEQGKAFLDTIPQTHETELIRKYLEYNTKWSIIVGWDSTEVKWADMEGGLKAKVDAEVIAEEYNN